MTLIEELHVIKFSCVIQSAERLEGYLRGARTVTHHINKVCEIAKKHWFSTTCHIIIAVSTRKIPWMGGCLYL